MEQSNLKGLGARMDSLDERVERIESQIGTLVTTVQKFTEALTDLVRVDERVAQLLLTNQHLGTKVEQQNAIIAMIQVDLTAVRTRVDALQEDGRGQKRWLSTVVLAALGVLASIILLKLGLSSGPITP